MSKAQHLLPILPFLLIPLLSEQGLSQEQTSAPDPATTQGAMEWVSRSVIPLSFVEAGNGFEDLAALREILADVRVVGLGEATHGTREIFQFKHRMLEFLVKEMGFTLFAIEASFPAALNVNRYVLYGEGDPHEALASMGFWTWDTEEVSAMIEWMRDYNRSVPDARKVRFLGNDLQYIDASLEVVEDFVGRTAPGFLPVVQSAFEPVRIDPYEISSLPQASDEEKARTAARLHAVVGYLVANREALVWQSSETEFDWVVQHARIPVQFYDAYSKPMFDPENPAQTGGALRDLYMARNIEWLLESAYPGAKMVVWAHNGHVSASEWGGAIPAMGKHLKQVFGDAYYVFGFDFKSGGFQARHLHPDLPDEEYGVLREFVVGPPRDGTMAHYLGETIAQDFILDLRSIPHRGPARDFFSTPLPMANLGAGFAEAYLTQPWRSPVPALDHYDGLIFLQETTRARPNPSGRRGPIPRESIGNE